MGKVKVPREELARWRGCAVHLFAPEREWAQDTINEHGFFVLERLPPGAYEIRVDAGEQEIWLGEISV